MDEHSKKINNVYKYLDFPFGIIASSIAWFAAVKAIWPLLEALGISHPIWLPECITSERLEVFFILFGVLFISIFLFIYPRVLPKGDKHKLNIFIAICPEDLNDDKYITEDFVTDFKRYASGIPYLNIIVPNYFKRRFFNKKIKEKREEYWTGKRGERINKKLKGALYIYGTLTKRMSNKQEHFIFSLSATISYNDFNKQLTPVLQNELKTNFPTSIKINKSFEFEQIATMSSQCAVFSQHIIATARLVSGDIQNAYKMHKDILDNNKQSFYKRGLLQNVQELVHFELGVILQECKKYSASFINECAKTLLELFPTDSISLMTVSRSVVMTSTETEFYDNVKVALELVKKVKINSKIRANLYSHRAYLFLLLKQYEKAEREYAMFFKYFDASTAQSIIEYCKEQISSGTIYEKPTALYVQVIMQFRLAPQADEMSHIYSRAKRDIPESETYYHQKLSEINIEQKQKKKHKKINALNNVLTSLN